MAEYAARKSFVITEEFDFSSSFARKVPRPDPYSAPSCPSLSKFFFISCASFAGRGYIEASITRAFANGKFAKYERRRNASRRYARSMSSREEDKLNETNTPLSLQAIVSEIEEVGAYIYISRSR